MRLRALLALNLRQFRRERGLRQHQLAALAGVDQSFISHIERESRDVTLATVEMLASALGVPAVHLFAAPLSASDQQAAGASSPTSCDDEAGAASSDRPSRDPLGREGTSTRSFDLRDGAALLPDRGA